MKAIKILTMAALATAVASCSNDEDLAQNNYPMDNVVRIMTSVDGMNTRASYGNSTDKLKSFGFCIKNANSEKYTYDNIKVSQEGSNWIPAQWKFSGDKHKSLQVDTERTFHQRYPLVML